MRRARWMLIVLAVLFPAASSALGQTVTCSSDDGEKHYCTADTRYGAHLVRQSSAAACTEGTTWGFDEQGIWVDKGCGGEFALGRGQVVEEPADAQTITCTSDNGARKYCAVPTRGGVQMLRQRSDAACVQGKSWGYDDKGIWVNRGCSAEFVVGVPGHPTAPSGPPRSERVSCTSDDGRRNYCDMELQDARVQLARQLSAAMCQEGVTWGYDKGGIWVDRGCRGDFLVTEGGPTGPVEKSCAELVGKERAKEFVEECKKVTTGSHAPCNAKNSCKMITDEIRRDCELLGANGPAFCGEYK